MYQLFQWLVQELVPAIRKCEYDIFKERPSLNVYFCNSLCKKLKLLFGLSISLLYLSKRFIRIHNSENWHSIFAANSFQNQPFISTARCSSVPSCLRYIPSHPSIHPSIRPTFSFDCSKLFYVSQTRPDQVS